MIYESPTYTFNRHHLDESSDLIAPDNDDFAFMRSASMPPSQAMAPSVFNVLSRKSMLISMLGYFHAHHGALFSYNESIPCACP